MKATAEPKFKVLIVAPTCFFYQAPIFRELATHPRIDLKVYFCSREALNGGDILKQFRARGNWGDEIETLSGYEYQFLRNYSPWPSYLRWPIGLMNLGIWGVVKRENPDAVVLMSWVNITEWLAAAACSSSGIPFLYMTDTNGQAEPLKPKWKSWLKNLLLAKGFFRFASGFLLAGTANRHLYNFYGVPNDQLVPFAYSWQYKALLEVSAGFKAQKSQIREELGISEDSCVVLFCGRFSAEKNTSNLLEAYARVNNPNKVLVLVGDGPLQQRLKEQVAEHDIKSVYFTGFQNRSEIPKYYAMSDIFVLPSSREATGAVLSEAMCFGLPVAVSYQVGFGTDLVYPGVNGYRFEAGDVSALADYIEQFMQLSKTEQETMGKRSLSIITEWSRRDLGVDLVKYLDFLRDKKLTAAEIDS